jgi:lipoyl(octanoyl) transferase
VAPELLIDRLGCVPYAEALELQRKCVEARRSGAGPDRLLLLEHPPVVTLGRSARERHLRESRASLAARGVEVVEVARGGDVTYHAPGQLVGYAILDLEARGRTDVHAFLRELESGLGEALEALGVAWRCLPGWTGVFAADDRAGAPPRKLASIGVGLRGWITCHGFALNVDLDLAGFDAIVPCGLHAVQMSSLARELGPAVPADLGARALAAVADAFAKRWS